MTDSPISVVIPSWNSKQLTHDCLASLRSAYDGADCEVIVVDNASHDGSVEMIETMFPHARLIKNAVNEYFSKACNQGVSIASREYVCLLNSDTVVLPGSLKKMVSYLQDHPDCGAVAPKLLNPDGTVQAICKRFPTLMEVLVDQFDLSWWPRAGVYRHRTAMKDFDHLSDRDVEQPPGACLVMRRSDYLTLGGLDEALPLFYSDVDLCWKIWRSSYRIRFIADAQIVHVGSASITRHPLWRAEYMRDQVRYFRKVYGRLAGWYIKMIILASTLYFSARTALGSGPISVRSDYAARLWRSMKHVIKA
jgi:N-acetylglucosaminyl-diphospho-decaprenol L-rhamnosyltransferase